MRNAILITVMMLAALAMAAPKGLAKGHTKTPTPKPTADEICAEEQLEEPLLSVCTEWREQQAAAEDKTAMDMANAVCAQIIEPELKEICVQLELAKLSPIAIEASMNATEDNSTEPSGATTPQPESTSTEKSGFGGLLSSFFGGLMGGSAPSLGEVFGSLTTDEGLGSLGPIGDALTEFVKNGFGKDTIGASGLKGQIASLFTSSELRGLFDRVLSESHGPLLGDDGKLSKDKLTDLIKKFLNNRGIDTENLQERARQLADAFLMLREDGRLMADSGLLSTGVQNLLANSEQGQVLSTWAQKLVEIWRANRKGLAGLPRPDLAALASQAQEMITERLQAASKRLKQTITKGVAKGLTTGLVKGIVKGATKGEDSGEAEVKRPRVPILGDIPIGRLDSLFTQELKNQAMATLLHSVSQRLLLIGKDKTDAQ